MHLAGAEPAVIIFKGSVLRDEAQPGVTPGTGQLAKTEGCSKLD